MDQNDNRPNMYRFCPKYDNVIQFEFDLGCKKYPHEGSDLVVIKWSFRHQGLADLTEIHLFKPS